MKIQKQSLYRIAAWFLSPIRFAIRKEFRDFIRPILEKDISHELSRRALVSTADYIEKNMSGVRSYANKLQLFDAVLPTVTHSGLWLEFGVYRGETINYIAGKTHVKIFGFDSFEGLPEFWRDGFEAGHFSVSKLPPVAPNVELIKGWFNETLPPFMSQRKGGVSFIHVDCDLYSSTKTIFENCGSQIKEGTVIVFDEYFNYPGWQHGEYKAFKEFIASHGLGYEYIGYVYTHEQVAVRIVEAPHSHDV